MEILNTNIDYFVPDGSSIEDALKRATHMAISAHPDDIEIMAYDGIINCFNSNDKWFLGVIVTDGAGSSRNGFYKDYTNEQMKAIRKLEQKKAAFVGEYSAVIFLNHSSEDAKNHLDKNIESNLKNIFSMAQPKLVYTHTPLDSHSTHLNVSLKVINALREIAALHHLEKLYGCEVWRGLDWLIDSDKVIFDCSSNPNISSALIEVFDSQVSGGKRYDLATQGRRLSNATFMSSNKSDSLKSAIYGMDLTPLIKNTELDIKEYIKGFIDRFGNEVLSKL